MATLVETTRPERIWWRGWFPLVTLPGLVFGLVPEEWPRWAFMWTLAFAIFCGCKWLTWRRADVRGVPAWRQTSYLLVWPGLDAEAFLKETTGGAVRKPTVGEWGFAAGKLALGVCLVFGVSKLVPGERAYLVGWVGMVGIVMSLHFGGFHLLSCAWRSVGVDARPLMDWPLAAMSVSEFWGKRWNTAFRDLTHRFLFRPLTPLLGARRALFAGFVFSGVVHDLVISVPAGGGYGGPTLFFLVQGLALLVERSAFGRKVGLGHGVRGWAFTACALLGPAGLLFHRPFVEGIIVPFLRALGAIP